MWEAWLRPQAPGSVSLCQDERIRYLNLQLTESLCSNSCGLPTHVHPRCSRDAPVLTKWLLSVEGCRIPELALCVLAAAEVHGRLAAARCPEANRGQASSWWPLMCLQATSDNVSRPASPTSTTAWRMPAAEAQGIRVQVQVHKLLPDDSTCEDRHRHLLNTQRELAAETSRWSCSPNRLGLQLQEGLCNQTIIGFAHV